ncbi:MAG: hypothetical protein FJ206_04365 [Gemmatimonadetes bacterium]|nr:hypothetical protein [Gemmatimonadota bacterium]
MTAIESAFERARVRQPRIALVGQGDGLIEQAGELLSARGLGRVTIVGPGGSDPVSDRRLPAVANVLRERWPERVRDGIHALDLAANPLLFAAGLTAAGEVDICLGGTAVPTDALEEAARWLTGKQRATQGRGHMAYVATVDGRLLTVAMPDSAGPLDARGIAQVAVTAATHRQRAVGETPWVGFLVAPPSQDASHADAELALAEFRAIAPGIQATVEWDWSSDPADEGRYRSRPNVLIFPDPVAAHLALLLLREAAGLQAWGPMFPSDRWVLAGVARGQAEDVMTAAALAAAGLAGS